MSIEHSLFSQTRKSLVALTELRGLLESPECLHQEEVASFDIPDNCRRLMTWASNIGALQGLSKRSSLDSRLREAPHIRQQVSRLLLRLKESCDRAALICKGVLPNRVEEESEVDDLDSINQLGDGSDTRISEVQELLLSVSESITRLFKLSMAIRNPIPRDRYAKMATIKEVDSKFDIAHIEEKFPLTRGSWLSIRLGKANSQRRDYFRYRRRHKEKLEKEEEEYLKDRLQIAEDITEEKPDHRLQKRPAESSLGSTKASTYVEANASKFLFMEADQASDTAVSETSFATSVNEDASLFLHVPPPPIDLDENTPFVCPYCFLVQAPTNKRAWKRHVFDDLQPYICTFESCPVKPFASRRAWFEHELGSHRKEWICNLCQTTPFQTAFSFKIHLQNDHSEEVVERQFATLIDICGESLDKLEPKDCPLCDDWDKSIKLRDHLDRPYVTLAQFRSHLGRHLEQVALFSLPKFDRDGDSIGESNDAVQDASSAEESIHDTEASASEYEEEAIDAEMNRVSNWQYVTVARIENYLREGANVNSRGKDGVTILHKAIEAGNVDVVRLLLKSGADANLSSLKTYPIIRAIRLNEYEMVRDLLNLGADPDCRTDDGKTSLHHAAGFNGNIQGIMSLLLDHGADINALDDDGNTPLQIAKMFHRPDRIEFLEQRGALDADDVRGAQASSHDDILQDTVIRIQRRWRKLHLERYLPLEPHSITEFSEAAWIILKLHRKGRLKAPEKFPQFPSEPTMLEKVWSRMYDENAEPTNRFIQFLQGIAMFLIEDFEPKQSIVISPMKMQRFYDEMHIDEDTQPWQVVFDDRTSQISRLFREFEVEHHLTQDSPDMRPDIPGLTPRGFAMWMILMMRIYPQFEKPRLAKIVREYPIGNADDPRERFPKEVSYRLFPNQPDREARLRFEDAIKRYCAVDIPRPLEAKVSHPESERVARYNPEPVGKALLDPVRQIGEFLERGERSSRRLN